MALATVKWWLNGMGDHLHHILQTTITHYVLPDGKATSQQHLEDWKVLWYGPSSIFCISFHRRLEQSYKAIKLLPVLWALAQLWRATFCLTWTEYRSRVGSQDILFIVGMEQGVKARKFANVSPTFCPSQHKICSHWSFSTQLLHEKQTFISYWSIALKSQNREIEANYWLNYLILLIETYFNN